MVVDAYVCLYEGPISLIAYIQDDYDAANKRLLGDVSSSKVFCLFILIFAQLFLVLLLVVSLAYNLFRSFCMCMYRQLRTGETRHATEHKHKINQQTCYKLFLYSRHAIYCVFSICIFIICFVCIVFAGLSFE